MDAQVARASTDRQVVKRATSGARARRIVAEADLLAAGQIPGVVELVAVDGDGEWPCLVTTRVDGPDLGRVHDLSVEEVAGVVAAVATILADLHDQGLVHGAVMASHVLVGPDGRPVLCGLGYGGRVGDPPVAEAPLPQGHRDPARRSGDPLAPSADLYALGALLRELATAALVVTTRSPVAARWVARAGRRIGRPGWAGPDDRPARDALLAVADRATTTDPRLRIGARSLAAAVGLAVPDARLPRRLDPDRGTAPARPEASTLPTLRHAAPPSSGVSRRKCLVLGAGLAVAVAVLVALRLLPPTATAPTPVVHPPSEERPPLSAPLAPAAAPATTTVSAAQPNPTVPPTPATTAGLNPGCPAVTSALVADTDGDGCLEALRWADGVLEAGDRHWSVGQAGDRVATADWSCSGRATLALLRPATGQVFVFGAWAEPGHDLVARVTGHVDRGFAIRAADLGDGCPRVAVERSDGAPVTLPKPSFSSP